MIYVMRYGMETLAKGNGAGNFLQERVAARGAAGLPKQPRAACSPREPKHYFQNKIFFSEAK